VRICLFAHVRNGHAQRMAAGLAARGHEVHVVIMHEPVSIPGVTVERFSVPLPGLSNPHRWRTRHVRYLRGFLRRFDVVVVFFLLDWGFAAEMLEESCLIASPRGSDILTPPGERPPPPELVEKRVELLRHAAGIGVGGRAFSKIVARFAGIDEGRIDLLPLGVDLNLFSPGEPSRGLGDGQHRVGFFKGFREVYGAADLIRAIPAVLAAVGDTRFDMIGEGSHLPECQALARQLGVDSSIRWLPAQPHREIPRHLANWDVSVMPSFCESFGLAALESSAMRVPVVASNVGGLVETVLSGVTGLHVEPGSPGPLAEAIVTLLEDVPLRERMGRAGREFVRREYEWNRVLDDWMAMFRRSLDRACVMV